MTDELTDLRRRAEMAEADAGALHIALRLFIRHGAGNLLPSEDFDYVQLALGTEASARLLAELEAARAIVEFAREEWSTSTDLRRMLRVYDAAVKGSET